MIAIELLTAHPGNVRRDVCLDEEFLASINELGILGNVSNYCKMVSGRVEIANVVSGGVSAERVRRYLPW